MITARATGVALLLLGAFAAVAPADTQTRIDPRGDTPSGEGLDLARVVVFHAGRDRIGYRITSHNTELPPVYQFLRVDIDTGGRPGTDYFVTAEGGDPRIENARTGRSVGGATFRRHSSRTISYVFSTKPLGLPDSYRWRVRLPFGRGSGDVLPNRGWIRHNLATGHD